MTVTTVKQNRTRREGRVHLFCVEEENRWLARRYQVAHLCLREHVRARHCQLFVLLRARCSTHTDAAYYLTIDNDRNAALQRREERVRQCNHRGATILNDVFECFSRTFEKHCGARFSDRDVCAGCEGPIE